MFRIFFRQLGEIPEMLQILVAKKAGQREGGGRQQAVVSTESGEITPNFCRESPAAALIELRGRVKFFIRSGNFRIIKCATISSAQRGDIVGDRSPELGKQPGQLFFVKT